MANRFLDTNYFKSPYVRRLKGSLKSLYSFIICDCDGAGIWNLDLQAASLYTGFEQSMEDFENHFINYGKAIHLGNNKFFFPDFIEHQYPKGLSEKNPAQTNFIAILKKFKVLNEDLSIKNKEALKTLSRPIGNGLSNGNGQVTDGGVGEDLIHDAELAILSSMVWFENLLVGKGKTIEQGKDSLRKFHLYLVENSKYPKTKRAICAGFEKWLMNEKIINGNGSTTHKPVATNPKQGISDKRTETARKW